LFGKIRVDHGLLTERLFVSEEQGLEDALTRRGEKEKALEKLREEKASPFEVAKADVEVAKAEVEVAEAKVEVAKAKGDDEMLAQAIKDLDLANQMRDIAFSTLLQTQGRVSCS